ncbi:MAG: hypothetical protein ACXABG_11965, partial [Promethearchaeota archaeon]
MEKIEIIRIFLQFNYNVSAETLEFIKNQNISEKELKEILQNHTELEPVISIDILKKNLKKNQIRRIGTPSSSKIGKTIDIHKVTTEQKSIHESSTKIRYVIDLDIPYKLSQEPKITVFRNLFLDRYQTL